MQEKDIRFARFVVLVNGAVPLALLLWDASQHRLGANPSNFAIRTTGMLALVFITLTLTVTPVRKLTGWNWLIFSRRSFGLFAFFYASLHFLLFFGLDRSFSISSTLTEMVKRKYLFVGLTGLLVMVPLAITSTNAMIKRLGGVRWRKLHRLAYIAAIAGVIHYYLLVKADVRQPLAFAFVLAVLLAYRLITYANRPAPVPVAAATLKPTLWSGPLRVIRIRQETPEVRTFRFAPPDGGRLPFDHLPGQYLILSLPIDGQKVNRTYTIASAPTRSDYCEITVKREANGRASCHLHDAVREGDQLTVTAPAGRFTFDGNGATSVVLLAGGVGITPVMAMLRYLTDQNWPGNIYFIYCAKTPPDIIFRSELDDLQARFRNLHLVVALTRADGTDWSGVKGRLSRDLLIQTIPNLSAQTFYLCGPGSMMEPTIQLLRELGVPAEKIRTEAFGAAKKTEAQLTPAVAGDTALPATPGSLGATSPAANGNRPTLTFSRSARTTPLVPDQTLLEIAEAAGLSPDFECRSGICGRCKTRLLAGCVTMDVEDALDDRDRSGNIILLCQAKASASVTIEV